MSFTQYYAPEHVEQDQTDTKWPGKELISQCKCRRVGRSLIIVNKKITETENLIFFFLVQDQILFHS